MCRGVQALVAPPMTATVGVPARTAAACAAPSIPSARPETTVAPRAATPSEMRPAVARPVSVGRRVPTIATERGRSSAAGSPCRYRTWGGRSITAGAKGRPRPRA